MFDKSITHIEFGPTVGPYPDREPWKQNRTGVCEISLTQHGHEAHEAIIGLLSAWDRGVSILQAQQMRLPGHAYPGDDRAELIRMLYGEAAKAGMTVLAVSKVIKELTTFPVPEEGTPLEDRMYLIKLIAIAVPVPEVEGLERIRKGRSYPIS